MRIDLIITELDVGGAERCCAELAKFLQKENHQVRVIALGQPPPKDREQLVVDLLERKIPIEFLGATGSLSLWSVRRKLRTLVRACRPDAAQSFLWHANVVSASLYPGFGVPLFGGVRVMEPRRWRAHVARWASLRMTKVVCVSDDVARWCRQFENIPASKLCVIPNGIEVDSEIPTVAERGTVPDRCRILLFVGRLASQKGADVLLDRTQFLLAQLPEHHLVLIGDGPMTADWKTYRQQSPFAQRIHLLGQRNDVRSWMREAELFVLPTRYEGMPNVLLEAMASGIPVVLPRVEGVEQILDGLANDQTVARDDWDAWLKLVLSLAQDEQRRNQLGKANRDHCETSFRLTDQMTKYVSLYQEHVHRTP